MPGSLSDWASKLSKEDFKFIFDDHLRKKQELPYSHFCGNIQYVLTRPFLPPECSEDAIKIYEKYECNCVNDYMMLYLKIDVLLLAEIFEKFIETSIKRYSIDPSWFFTTPGYAWYN